MLTVGKDSYVTLQEANEIIGQCYINQPPAERWAALSEQERAAYLRTAAYRIDCLPLSGHKHSSNQALQFPRGLSQDIPYRIKLAQIEEALAASDTQLLHRLSLQQQGVTSVNLGNASESYSDSAAADTRYARTLLSNTAYNYMRPYLLGSAVIV